MLRGRRHRARHSVRRGFGSGGVLLGSPRRQPRAPSTSECRFNKSPHHQKLKSIGRPYGPQLDQRATSAHCWPPLRTSSGSHRASTKAFETPPRQDHTSVISLTSKTRSGGRRQYLLLSTHGQFRGDLCARPPGAATPTSVGSYRSPGPPTPQPLKTGFHMASIAFGAYNQVIPYKKLGR